MEGWARRTGCVGELILLSLDSVLESFGFAAGLLDTRLHGLGRHIAGALRIHRGRKTATRELERGIVIVGKAGG